MPKSPPDSDIGFAGIGKRLSKLKSKTEALRSVDQNQQPIGTSPDHHTSLNFEAESASPEASHYSAIPTTILWHNYKRNLKLFIGLLVILGLGIFGWLVEDKQNTVKRIDSVKQNIKIPIRTYPSTPEPINYPITKRSEPLFVETLKANVRKDPGGKGSVITKVKIGQEVIEIRREGDWVQVGINFDTLRKDYEYTGWMHNSVLKNRDEVIHKLRTKIETGRSQISSLELKLKTMTTNMEKLKERIISYKTMLKNQEKQARLGIDINKNLYQNNLDEHNRMAREFNKTLTAFNATVYKYNKIIDQDRLLVRKHNELLKR